MENRRERSAGMPETEPGRLRIRNLNLPDYNDGLGKLFELPDRSQSDFKSVVTEVYPLRADLEALRTLCDSYLNADKDQPVRFEPTAPWVLLQACKYGKMAFREQNVGWVSQHELAFGFMVRVSERDAQDPPEFRTWAMVYPFIYVDNPLSMSLGRQVYGWGKAGMELLAPRPDPEPHTRCLLSVNLTAGPERNAARTPDAPRFLEIFQEGSALSGNTGIASLYTLFPRMLQGSLQTVSGFLGAAASFSSGVRKVGPIRFPSGENIEDFLAQLRNMAEQVFGAFDYLDLYLSAVARMARDFEFMQLGQNYQLGNINIVTLKQVRDAEDTNQACYRALVTSHMGFNRLLDGGMLRTDLISPDPSGGIQIRMNQSGGDHIVNALGIAPEYKDGANYVLRPVSPFWLKADLTYGAADRQYWRTRETSWSTNERPDPSRLQDTESLPYIKEGSGAGMEIPGAIISENFTYQLYALPANENTLNELLDEYLRKALDGSDYTFEPRRNSTHPMPGQDGSYFILAMFSSNFITGGEDRRRKLSDRVITFALPIWCSLKSNPDKKRRALAPLYTLVEEDWDFFTESEVYGRFAFKSLIEGIAPSWIEKHNVNLQVLRASTFLFPKLSKEEPARLLPLVQVDSGVPVFEVSEIDQPALDESKASPTTLAYLELLGINISSDRTIRYISLKQIRDAVDFEAASYQALVGVTSQVEKLLKPQEALPIDLLMYTYEDKFDMVSKMGVKNTRKTELLVDELRCTVHSATTLPGVRIQGVRERRTGENLSWCIRKSNGKGVWEPRRKEPIFFSLRD